MTHEIIQGQLYYLANDPSLPEEVRTEWSSWGYAKDEFTDNGHFPRRMYARGVRRMMRDDLVITTRWHDYDIPAVEVPDPVLVNLWPMVSGGRMKKAFHVIGTEENYS